MRSHSSTWVFATAAVLVWVSSSVAGPLAVWSFNESGGNTAANSVAGAAGSLAGNVAFVPGGVSGNCLEFPVWGAGYVSMGNGFGIDANPEFSVSAWFKTSDATDDMAVLSRHYTGVNNGYIVQVNGNNFGYLHPQKAFWYVNAFPGSELPCTTSVTDGAWHHVVCTARFVGTGTIREIWIDGVRENFNAFGGGSVHPTPLFMVGGIYNSGSGPNGYYQGRIDEVQLYDYAVSSTDIANMHANPTAVAGPAACFGDLNNDGQHNTADLTILLAKFGQTVPLGTQGDITYDGVVNTADLTSFLGRFGAPCP